VTRYKTVRDDSEGEAWTQKRAQIQNSFAEKNDQLSRELSVARRKKSSILSRQDAAQAKLQSIEYKIQQLTKNIAIEIEKVEEEKKHAEQEYINNQKKSLEQQVHTYLLGDAGVLVKSQENIKATSEKVEQAFGDLAMERFTKALQQKLTWIDQVKQEKSPEILRQVEGMETVCQRLQCILTEMGVEQT
jgi:hypothetical protein